MPTQEEIKNEILKDIKSWLIDILGYELAFRDHLRWVILKRLILNEKCPARDRNGKIRMLPEKDYTKSEIQSIIREMEKETSKDLERIHLKYLW